MNNPDTKLSEKNRNELQREIYNQGAERTKDSCYIIGTDVKKKKFGVGQIFLKVSYCMLIKAAIM